MPYIPTPGTKVKLRRLDHYYDRGWHPWSWLTVLETPEDLREVAVNVQPEDSAPLRIDLADVEPPLGWAEKYTICVAPDKIGSVLGWLSRGVAVHPCQDLGMAGMVIYQPADDCPTPHWAYSEIADIVPPDQVRNRIRITKYEREVARVPRPCRWADHPKHGNDCYACHGTGVAQTPITEIKKISGPNGRQSAKKELKGQGWKLTFNLYINEWEMERETVVKDFGQEIPNG